MPWNPDIYDQFKKERSAPYFDLIKLIEIESDMSVIDLGCGTGELTSGLLDFIPNSKSSASILLQKCFKKQSNTQQKDCNFSKEA
jgi:trans-aconitate 2-methyltransferase